MKHFKKQQLSKNIFTCVISCEMKILSINSYTSPFLYPVSSRKNSGISFGAKKTQETDFFELSHAARAKQVYSKLNKLTKEEYMALTEAEKDFLRSENRLLIEEGVAPLDRDIRTHNFAASAIQEVFDKQFGTTFLMYLNKIRLHHAVNDLLSKITMS